MCTISETELATVMASFDLEAFTNLDPEEFIGFGTTDSGVYRRKFLSLARVLSKPEMTIVISLCCMVKNRKRILDAMIPFGTTGLNKTWYPNVRNFISNVMVSYSREADHEHFVCFHVPNAFPFYAATVWKKMAAADKMNYEGFIANTWVPQIAIDKDVQAEQMIWERDFWTNTVTKTKNTHQGSYEAGFHQAYYDTKAADEYPLLKPNNTVHHPAAGMFPANKYTRDDITAWINL